MKQQAGDIYNSKYIPKQIKMAEITITREARIMYRHGFCYKCERLFFSTNDCHICKILRKRAHKANLKRVPVNFDGPTKLSDEFVDRSISTVENDAWILRERFFDCKYYEQCLDFAIYSRWRNFTCRYCKYFVEEKEHGKKSKVKEIA